MMRSCVYDDCLEQRVPCGAEAAWGTVLEDLEDSTHIAASDRPSLWVVRGTHVGVGEFILMPHSVEHQPHADQKVHMLLFEPAGIVNTGSASDHSRMRTVLVRV